MNSKKWKHNNIIIAIFVWIWMEISDKIQNKVEIHIWASFCDFRRSVSTSNVIEREKWILWIFTRYQTTFYPHFKLNIRQTHTHTSISVCWEREGDEKRKIMRHSILSPNSHSNTVQNAGFLQCECSTRTRRILVSKSTVSCFEWSERDYFQHAPHISNLSLFCRKNKTNYDSEWFLCWCNLTWTQPWKIIHF